MDRKRKDYFLAMDEFVVMRSRDIGEEKKKGERKSEGGEMMYMVDVGCRGEMNEYSS